MESLIAKGGWIMVPIIAGSIIALTLVLERVLFFWTIRLNVKSFAKEVFAIVDRGNIKDALDFCSKTKHPLGAVFQAALEHASDESSEIERIMEREGNRQVRRVEKNLNYLVVVVGVEPLMGFLGTILGLIRAFMAWEKFSTSVTVSQLAGGIYQAMLTTAAGLIIAIPYFVIYNIFLAKVNTVTQDVNHYGDELLSVLHKAKSRIK